MKSAAIFQFAFRILVYIGDIAETAQLPLYRDGKEHDMHILFAEDDVKLGKLLKHLLEKEDFTVDWVTNGSDAYAYATATDYDLILLDWMLPGEEGVNVCRRLREEEYEGAILMLTAKDELDHRVEGLDAGADDYLVKPFEFEELFARVRALLRRRNKPIIQDQVNVGSLTLDRSNHLLIKSGRKIPLTSREFRLMELLMVNHGQVLPRELILDRIWGMDAEVNSNTLDAYIRLLRKKIGDSEAHQYIKNVRGVGYRLEP
jgi:DNA-binding response OmpR family regulator